MKVKPVLKYLRDLGLYMFQDPVDSRGHVDWERAGNQIAFMTVLAMALTAALLGTILWLR